MPVHEGRYLVDCTLCLFDHLCRLKKGRNAPTTLCGDDAGDGARSLPAKYGAVQVLIDDLTACWWIAHKFCGTRRMEPHW